MHILQAHNSYRQRGGEDTVVAADARLLRSAGHAVTQYIVPNPVGSMETGMRLGTFALESGSRAALPQAAGSTEPDIVHFHNTWFS